MQKELKGKIVKVYIDPETKREYEGDGRIERVIKQFTDDLFYCDISFPDDYFSTTIDVNDVLY